MSETDTPARPRRPVVLLGAVASLVVVGTAAGRYPGALVVVGFLFAVTQGLTSLGSP